MAKNKDFRIWICMNPACEWFQDEVELPSQIEHPICNDCNEELEEETNDN